MSLYAAVVLHGPKHRQIKLIPDAPLAPISQECRRFVQPAVSARSERLREPPSSNNASLSTEIFAEALSVPHEAMLLVKAVRMRSVVAARHFQLYAPD
jgi:hypothetical protein